MVNLSNQVALVTGASRGVGRGVALGLAASGANVFATGRSIKQSELGADITTIVCDHTNDEAVAEVFRHIDERVGRLDILVNVAWGGYERMVEDGRFTWASPFWEQPSWRWEAMVTAGVRAAFVASQHAARRMVPARRGLIVHVSSWAAQKYGGNVVYGLAKAATDTAKVGALATWAIVFDHCGVKHLGVLRWPSGSFDWAPLGPLVKACAWEPCAARRAECGNRTSPGPTTTMCGCRTWPPAHPWCRLREAPRPRQNGIGLRVSIESK